MGTEPERGPACERPRALLLSTADRSRPAPSARARGWFAGLIPLRVCRARLGSLLPRAAPACLILHRPKMNTDSLCKNVSLYVSGDATMLRINDATLLKHGLYTRGGCLG